MLPREFQLKTARIDWRDFKVDMVHISMDQVFTYVGFRVGGLGYGPRFRCLQPTHGLMVEVGRISNPPAFQCSDSLPKVSQIVTDTCSCSQPGQLGLVNSSQE